ncbi:MAG: DUF4430 domain-containing protein [Oscillospiraceae bacterium]|nr:DUF4430 domain-containing protein [Oscillospiraceae bacterium]
MSLILVVLIAAMVLSLAACGSKDEGPANAGTKSFVFEVVDPEGKSETFDIKTDAATVGEALMAEGLVEGEEGPYGLYVKTVTGLTLDYETDGMYWAFYVNGEYGMSGCELTEIEDGASYAFKAEK